MAKTPKLGLTVTSETETDKSFLDFRKELAGDTESNMTIIDTKVGNLEDNCVTKEELTTSLEDYAPSTHTHGQEDIEDLTKALAGKADESDVTNLERRVSDLESGNWFPELHLAGTKDAPKVDLTYEGGYLRIHVEAAE